ncbi:hypothetical protein HPG69_003327 [Diceros bicornis minor]|uniref:Uncharacterized protein n=1 Tax=Diceros bicornis minor TaxID=77932 RepID=A0A7J7E8P4_DICBM|nr:hypothetical protein HPG69_003327 [Diceros bicornis minor]
MKLVTEMKHRVCGASEETLHSSNEEEDPFRGMEPYLVRRLSCRNVQLPPLAFRQLEQADLKSESENIQRPTSLPLKILPLIAITSADSSGNSHPLPPDSIVTSGLQNHFLINIFCPEGFPKFWSYMLNGFNIYDLPALQTQHVEN